MIDQQAQQVAEKETGRLEAFSDGVFAIAITLLVLDLHVPPINDGPEAPGLLSQLLQDWPVYLAFLISFLTILIMWINHHRLFTAIRRTDHALLVLNGLLLLGVTVVPFPTKLVAEFLGHRDQTIAVMVYNGTFVMIAIFFNMLWRYASYNNRLFDSSTDPELVRRISQQFVLGPVAYLIAFVLAIFSAPASLALSMLLALFYALPSSPLTAFFGD